MDTYTLILVSDDRSPVKRFQLPKIFVKRAAWGGVALAFVFLLATWDYWRKTADNAELDGLRVESAEQREQIEVFKRTLSDVQGELARVKELERKVRIIANLPGAAAVGGEGVQELVPAGAMDAEGQPIGLPAGVPVPPAYHGRGGGEDLDVPMAEMDDESARTMALTTEGARYIHGLGSVADELGGRANQRGDSLDRLLVQLDEKSVKLASMPSVWPARGWLTSRFGPRVSPFTGRTQRHSGIDIASKLGTPIISPAHGRVIYAGRKGPLGNALVIDHGFGVKTVYGHTQEIHVKTGEEVGRGQKVASVGSSGRSTGPHLHYVVEVNGKPRDPLDYIFD
jgi:murein DD-endopeptidase MepM/ murein hydrolase activator NlpD